MPFNYSYNKQAEPDLLYAFILSNTSVVPLNFEYNLATFDIVVSYSVALTIGEEGDLNNAISNYTYVDTNNSANFNTVLVADISATKTVTSSSYSGNGSGLTNLQTPYVSGGTYNPATGVATYNNATGGTFTISGFTVSGGPSFDVYVTGGTPNNSAKTYIFTNNSGNTFTVNGLTDITITGGTLVNTTLTLINNTGGTITVTGFSNTFTGGTVTGATTFTNGLVSNTISATTYQNLPTDIRVTGGSLNQVTGVATYTNNTGGTFTVNGFYTNSSDIRVTGGTYSNTTGVSTFTNNTGGTFNINGYFKPSDDIYTTGLTINNSNYDLTITRNDGTSFTANLGTLASDVTITGGTYNSETGVVTFENSSGGTFQVSGFTSGITDTTITNFSYNNNTFTINDSSGNTFNAVINTVTGLTVNGDMLSNTISATTYQNLPTDIRVTGGTYSSSTGNVLFTNNTGGTFNVGGFFKPSDDKYVTGFTYANNVLTIKQNNGETDLNVLVNTMTGLTVNGDTVSSTFSGTSYSGYSVTLSEMVSAATPSTGATFYLSSIGNRKLLGHKSSLGTTINYQPAMFNSKIAFWNPAGNVTTAPGIFGVGTLTATGTATARAVATTRLFTRTKRVAVVSANPAGSVCGYRSGVAQYTVGTGTAGTGGFYYVVRFGCGDALTNCRQFVGLRRSTAAPTDVEPSTLTNCIGVGHGIANTNLLIYYGGSAAQTPIQLGANFPNNTNSTDLYELVLYAPSTTNNEVWYQVTRLNTGDVASGRLTGTAGTALPASTTLLTNNDYRGNGSLAGIVTLEFISIYIETEN
jgi:hypothetical protein